MDGTVRSGTVRHRELARLACPSCPGDEVLPLWSRQRDAGLRMVRHLGERQKTMTAPRPRIMTDTLAPRLREPPGHPTKILKTRVPGRPLRATFQDRGSLAGDVSLAILSQRASATAKRERDPGDPTDMRVPRPERLLRHSYS